MRKRIENFEEYLSYWRQAADSLVGGLHQLGAPQLGTIPEGTIQEIPVAVWVVRMARHLL
jgi:hypothetical protein